MKKIPKFDIGDLVDVNPGLPGVSLEDVKLNPWKVREISISEDDITYRLSSKNSGTGYFEWGLVAHMKKPVILMRSSLAEETEENIAGKYLPVYKSRCQIPPQSLVIGRYSVLPYYKELVEDLAQNGSELINSYQQHKWIADMKEWYVDLEGLTPHTWFDLASIPEKGPFVLKGSTNSKKFQWNTHMFAENKQEAIKVYSRLTEDTLIGQQDIYIRQYVPLKKLEEGLNGLPITEEYRLFILDNQVISGAFYWSSHTADFDPSYLKTLTYKNIPQSFIDSVLTRIGSNARFVVVDIARKEDGDWIVIELNDGQQSGLSENDPDVLYKNLKNNLDF